LKLWLCFLGLGWIANAGETFAADPCTTVGRGWVLFEVALELDAAFAEGARAHLAAELEPRGVAVCRQASADMRAPLARVSVAGMLDGNVTLRIEDEVAETTVERRIDFAKVPPQGRALTFALAADELLGVGWATVIARKAAAETAVVQTKAAATTPPVALDKASTIGVLFINTSTFVSGLRFAGPQFMLARSFGRFVPEVRTGFRWGSSLEATHGQASFSDLNLAIGASWIATPLGWNGWVGPGVGIEVSRVSVRGDAALGASSQQGQGMAAVAHAGFMGVLPLSKLLRLAANVTGGYALIPVRAADSGQSLGGVEKFVVQANLGLGAMF
jgi:hypothetical protein